MGYQTMYTLSTDSAEEESIIANFREAYEEANYAINEEGFPQEPVKWYDSDDDLKEFSKQHPEVLFTLSGEGEESQDIWKLYVKNGKSQKAIAEITIAEYDESKLE